MEKINEIADYRKAEGLNYSFLKKVLNNDTNETVVSDAMNSGSMLDCLLTCEEEFDNEFIVLDVNRPKSDLIPILEDNLTTLSFDQELNRLAYKAKEAGFGGDNSKIETLEKKIETFRWYWEFLQKKIGKIWVTTAEYEEAKRIIWKLKNENPCKNIFSQEVIYQKPLYAELEIDGEMVKVKSLPDILIDKPNYIHYYDLKKTDYGFNSIDRFIKEGRSLMQMALTHDILEKLYGKKVLCSWIFVCKGNPSIVNVSPENIILGREGGLNVKDITYLRGGELEIVREEQLYGYQQAIKRYLQAQDLGLSNYNIERFYNKGVFNKSFLE